VSGKITGGSGFGFGVGDAVAITATVQPGTVSCPSGLVCRAQVQLAIQSGARRWTTASTSPQGEIIYFPQPGVPVTNVLIKGAGVLTSPSSFNNLDGGVVLTFGIRGSPTNPPLSGTPSPDTPPSDAPPSDTPPSPPPLALSLPAALSPPAAIEMASGVEFQFFLVVGNRLLTLSYEGQDCANECPSRLRLIFHPQLQTNWCWAATGEILMEEVAGTDFPQCEQVNKAFGGSINCCQLPTPASCNRTGALIATLKNFGFTADFSNRPLSYEEIQKEICQGQPIAFELGQWHVHPWSTDYHYMIVFGYETTAEGNFVWIYDPGLDKQSRIPYEQFSAPGAYYLWHRRESIDFVGNWYNVRKSP
jgi:hypothetical protein